MSAPGAGVRGAGTQEAVAPGALVCGAVVRWAIARWAIVGLGVALAAVALVPTDDLARAFAHPARVAHLGGAVPAATVEGAALVRVLAPLAGAALIALVLFGGRVCARTARLPAPPAATRVDALVLVAAMLAAMAVRLPLLAHSLWYDEIAAFFTYGVHGPGVAVGNYFTQANHTLQSLASWAAAALLGPSEFALRLPAFLAGIATVPAVWWLGREAWSIAAARGAAVAVAFMPVAVLASTEARGYAFMVLGAALCTAAFLWARRARHGTAWAVYALICALGGWAHLVTLCVPVFHGAWAAVAWLRGRATGAMPGVGPGAEPRAHPEPRSKSNAGPKRGTGPGHQWERRDAAAAFVALGVAALLTVALYAPVVPDMLAIRREFAAADGNEPTLLSVHGVQMLLMLGGAWVWWAALAGALAVACGVRAAWAAPALGRAVVLAMGGAVVAVAAAVAFDSWLYARFLLFMVPGVALLAGAGVAWVAARSRPAAWALALLVASAWVVSIYTLPPRQPLREGVAFIAAHRQPADRALAIGLPDDVHALYAEELGVPMPGTGPYGRDFAERCATVQPRWLLMLYPRAMPNALHAWVRDAGFTEVARFEGWLDDGDGDVVVFEQGEAGGGGAER